MNTNGYDLETKIIYCTVVWSGTILVALANQIGFMLYLIEYLETSLISENGYQNEELFNKQGTKGR